jgi:hypothetical protein
MVAGNCVGHHSPGLTSDRGHCVGARSPCWSVSRRRGRRGKASRMGWDYGSTLMMGAYTGVDTQFSCRSTLQDGMRVRHLLGIAIGDDQGIL